MTDIATSAGAEWAQLITTAVLGTDRRPLPRAAAGWETVADAEDPATELLNRAAAVATARRAGVQPDEAPLLLGPPPADDRKMCSADAANQLIRLLRGEHEVLLAEWFARCAGSCRRPPPQLVPTLLLRGRRNPAFDIVARAVIGPLAAWLADAMPDLGIKPNPAVLPAGADPLLAPKPPSDSGAVVTAIANTFLDRTATWAAAAQMRSSVAALEPRWLPALILELNRAPFNAMTERTRVDLLGLAQLRRDMIASLTQTAGADVVALSRG